MDLNIFITKKQRLNNIIVLFIDANNHKPQSPFYKFQKDHDLIDIAAQGRATPSMAIHYCDNRIFYILLSPDLIAGTFASGILPIEHHVISDQRASYCDIDTITLFSVPHIEEPIQSTRRKLQMSKPGIVTEYNTKIGPIYT